MWKLCISSTTTQPEIPTNIRQHGVLSTIPDITPTTHEHFVFSEYPGYPDDQASSITPMFFFQHIHILAQHLCSPNWPPFTFWHNLSSTMTHQRPIMAFNRCSIVSHLPFTHSGVNLGSRKGQRLGLKHPGRVLRGNRGCPLVANIHPLRRLRSSRIFSKVSLGLPLISHPRVFSCSFISPAHCFNSLWLMRF